MDLKATTPIPNPLGTRFVATWPEDCSGWQVTRHAPGEDGQPPMGAEEYAASLPKPWSSPAVTSFLSCPGPMAAFELACDGQRKAVGVKLITWGVNPALVGPNPTSLLPAAK